MLRPRAEVPVELLTFRIDERLLAVESRLVREVLRSVAVTPLPGAPEPISGVVDVRGAIRPVYQLSRKLGLQPRDMSSADHLLLADAGGILVLLQVDRVDGLVSAEVEPGVVSTRAPIAGLVRLEGGIAWIADLPAFLDAPEAALLAHALAEFGT